jgi:hypothetical protein
MHLHPLTLNERSGSGGKPALRRGDVCLIQLDPTRGSEIRRTPPCLVRSTENGGHGKDRKATRQVESKYFTFRVEYFAADVLCLIAPSSLKFDEFLVCDVDEAC